VRGRGVSYDLCAGIKGDGGQCGAQAIRSEEWCFNHPDYEKARRRRASRGGKRGGRRRPQADLSALKDKLIALGEDVLEGSVDRANAAVAGQLWNIAIRAIRTGLKAKSRSSRSALRNSRPYWRAGSRRAHEPQRETTAPGPRSRRGRNHATPEGRHDTVFDAMDVYAQMFLAQMDLFQDTTSRIDSEVLTAVRNATPESRRAFEERFGPIAMTAYIIAAEYQGGWVEVYRLDETGEVEKTFYEGDSEEDIRIREGAKPGGAA
jgi:hypothetical protein